MVGPTTEIGAASCRIWIKREGTDLLLRHPRNELYDEHKMIIPIR